MRSERGFVQRGLRKPKSAVFINRQTAGSQPTGGAPPKQGGNMSGVLRNASAAVSYARGAIFGIRGDIRNLFDRTAPPLERAISGGFLAFKLAVVAVVSFAIYQEWQQHVISQTEIAAAQALKLRAEADVAKPFINAQVPKLEPEAAVSKESTRLIRPHRLNLRRRPWSATRRSLPRSTPRRRLNRRRRPQLPRRSKSNCRLHPRHQRRSPRRRSQHRFERRQGSIAPTVSTWGRTM